MQTSRQAKTGNRNFLLRHTAATILGTSAALAGVAGCRSNAPQPMQATIIDNNPNGVDPAGANLAPAVESAPASTTRPSTVRVLGQQQSYTPQQSSERYPQQQYSDGSQPANDPGVDAGYNALEEASQPPPPLPVYDQPPAPEPNDLWTPGYWNYAPQGYFWVPGAWVAAPYAGALWTPGYWGYESNAYRFHRGFWARHIGFYGGINYGFGYTGLGYSGGYWNGNNFYYNRSVNRINVTNIHNVYERNVVVNNVTRVSYNGGGGGLQARPDPRELAVLHEQRTPAMSTQLQLRQESAQNRQQFFNQNHGQPAQVFATRPLPAERGIPAPAQLPQSRPADPRQQQPGVRPQAAVPQQRALQPQQEQQRTAQVQQQQRAQADQQRASQLQLEQQRNTTQQQRSIQQQPHTQQLSPRTEPMQRPEPQPQAQHAEPQPQVQHTQPQLQEHAQPRQPEQQHTQPQTPRQEARPEPHANEGRPR